MLTSLDCLRIFPITDFSPPCPARIVLLLENLKFGGTQRQALELARGLDRKRFQPEIWIMARGGDLSSMAQSWGIPLIQLSSGRKPGPIGLARLWQRLQKTPPDLLLTLTALPNIWGRVLGRLSGAPLVVGNVRGLLSGVQFERWLWPLADHILCNTQSLLPILNNDCKIYSSRITVIPNGVDTDFFRPPQQTQSGEPIILCVARMVPEKDHDTLIQAFGLVHRNHPATQLWLVGDGPRKPAMEQLVQRTLPPGQVRFLPGQTDLRPLLKQASLFALSSRHEAFPNVVLEAMAMGLPVVTSRVGGLPELVIPGETGWLTPPGNVTALAAAISQLLGDPQTRQAMGRAGRERVEQNFSLEAMVRQHEEVFAALLAQKTEKLLPLKKPPGSNLTHTQMLPRPGGEQDTREISTSGSPWETTAQGKSGPRVAYLLLWFPEPSQTFVLNEVNTLKRLGLDLQVYTLYGPRPPGRIAGMEPVLVPVQHLGLAFLRRLIIDLPRLFRDQRLLAQHVLSQTLVRNWRNLETAGEALWATLAAVHLAPILAAAKVDHIHASWANGPATGAWVASRLSGIPFSFTAHAHDIFPPDGALAEKIQAASFIRVVSAANQGYLLTVEPNASAKVHVIYCAPPMIPALAPHPAWQPPYQLLGIGRLIPKKGFPILLQACRELAAQGLDFQLTLVGDGPQRRELEGLIQEYSLGNRVRLLGFVPHRQVPALINRAHLFIMPSIIDPHGDQDSIPTVIMEALAHAVPVVATNVCGISEIILPSQTGWLLPPDDPQALVQAIREALANPAEARSRAQAGKRHVVQEFNSLKNYGNLKKLFEKYS